MRLSRLAWIAACAAAATFSTPSRAEPSAVTVVVQQPRTEVIEWIGTWRLLCTAPCEVSAAPGVRLYLRTPQGEDREIDVPAKIGARIFADDPEQRARRRRAQGAGVAMIVVGGLAVPIGLLWMVATVATHSCPEEPRPGPSSCHVPTEPAVGTMIGGVALAALGIAVLATAPSELRVVPATPPSPATRAAAAPAFATTEPPRLPAATTTTLYTLRF